MKFPSRLRSSERGSIVVIVAVCSMLLVGVAATAVDGASWYSRARDLQAAADAAALGGVVELADHDSPTQAVIEARRLLKANGIDPDDANLDVTITTANSQLNVTVKDKKVPLYFAQIFTDKVEISRSAGAKLDTCRSTCNQTVELPKPNLQLSASGTGDGFLPIVVPGSKMYAINHKTGPGTKMLTCVDRFTNAVCAGFPRALTSVVGNAGTGSGDMHFNNRPMHQVIGTKIYFAAQRNADWGLGCWDTATDTSCGYRNLANLAVGSGTYMARGAGPVLIDNKLYLGADNAKMYCVEPTTLTVCTNTTWPKNTGILNASDPTFAGGGGVGTIPMELEVAGTKIYGAIHYNTQQKSGTNLKTRIHCFDTATNASCSGFGTGGRIVTNVQVSGSNGGDGAIFFKYDTAKVVNGICLLRSGSQGVSCWNLNGAATAALPPAMVNALNPSSGSTMDMYAEFNMNGRTYFPEGWVRGATYCWDWTTNSTCGRKWWNNGTPNTADYGYVSNGKCFIGLGDSNVWWAFDKDMNACRDTAVTLVVQRCNCLDGRTKWGQLQVIDADLTAGVQFTEFKVTVKKPDGTVVMNNVNLLGTDGYLDLNSVPTDVASLTLEVEATSVAGYPAWAGGNAPKIDVRYREVPALVDPV